MGRECCCLVSHREWRELLSNLNELLVCSSIGWFKIIIVVVIAIIIVVIIIIVIIIIIIIAITTTMHAKVHFYSHPLCGLFTINHCTRRCIICHWVLFCSARARLPSCLPVLYILVLVVQCMEQLELQGTCACQILLELGYSLLQHIDSFP